MPCSELPTVDQLLESPFDGFGGSLDQQLRELADREEIRELIARYAQAVLRRKSMADMFTGDGVLAIHMPGLPVQEARGREQLEAIFARTAASPVLGMPAVHNVAIHLAGDDAMSTSWIELSLSDESDPDGRVFAGCGTYDDTLRRENGRWKFVRRVAVIRVVGAVQRAKPITAD